MFTASGDVLNSAIATLEGVARDALPRIAEASCTRIARVIDEQFADETDPYGAPWQAHSEATVARWGEHAILTLSGEMHSSAQVTSSGASIHVRVDGPSQFHQTGTENMVERPIVPDDGSIPAAYEDAIAEAAREVLP